jgi:hypothetical protein
MIERKMLRIERACVGIIYMHLALAHGFGFSILINMDTCVHLTSAACLNFCVYSRLLKIGDKPCYTCMHRVLWPYTSRAVYKINTWIIFKIFNKCTYRRDHNIDAWWQDNVIESECLSIIFHRRILTNLCSIK